MDDYLSGAMNRKDAIRLRTGLIATMHTAGLELDKWASNDRDIIVNELISKSCKQPADRTAKVKAMAAQQLKY